LGISIADKKTNGNLGAMLKFKKGKRRRIK
jgi:hypothetical protein